MTIELGSTRTDAELLQKKVAGVGLDTEKYVVEKSEYNKLSGWFLYKRTLGAGETKTVLPLNQ